MDNFDRVYSYLIEEEGLSPQDATRAMVIMVEQGFDPTQIFLRGLSGMLGFLPQKKPAGERVTTPRQKVKKPEMAKPIRDPWNQFPKKPQPQQGLPKTGPSSPLPTQKALPPARPIPTPKQTQGMLGVTRVPTSRELGQAPVPEFGPDKARPKIGPAKPPTAYEKIRPPADAGIRARNTLNRPQVPQGTVSALSTLASLARGITPGGVAAAVMAPRPAGDGTLTGALGRGDYEPMPPAPKAPEQKLAPVERTKAKFQPEVKRPEPPKPVDSRLQKYRELIKKGRHGEAKLLGKQIHADKYGVPTTKTA